MTSFDGRLLKRLLPSHGSLVVLAEAYFDESGTHDGSPIVVVGGYIFDSDRVDAFSERWWAALKEKGVEYFHTTEAVCQTGAFSHLSDGEADQLIRQLIPLIQEYTEAGFAISIEKPIFDLLVPINPVLADEYALVAWRLMSKLNQALGELGKSAEKTAFFFEAGHSGQTSFNDLINLLLSEDRARERVGYTSHAFVNKKESPAVQAADFLVWQTAKSFKQFRAFKRQRRDFEALISDGKHRAQHISQSELLELVGGFLEAGIWGEDQAFSELRDSN